MKVGKILGEPEGTPLKFDNILSTAFSFNTN